MEAMRAAFPRGAAALDASLDRPVVITSLMEHHSNILPWVEAVGRHNVRFVGVLPDGRLDLDHLRALLDAEGRRVRLVAVSGASNVTGLVTPIHEIAALAHRAGAQILVDGAQLAPHRRIDLSDIDFLVISGHKLYAPGSRGGLIGRIDLLDGRKCIGDIGGGMVEYVSVDDFRVRVKEELTAREEAGTPNIPGTIAFGLIAEALWQVGMARVEAHEAELCGYALDRLTALPGVTVYGTHEPSARVGVFSLNLEGIHHGLVAAFLDDYYNVAVRNQCFCAHPYVKALLGVDAGEEQRYLGEMACGDRRRIPGMARLSLGIYSTRADLEVAAEALSELWRHREAITRSYEATLDGSWHRPGVPAADPIYLPSSYLATLQACGLARSLRRSPASRSRSTHVGAPLA
ncbi:MAG: aminotransferase class V-fold PLP-dependent enzyme [Myxococcales bacterium]|nr:aminotransferase class V-fold PLP-dependent enzyme [Myxococcales bacterium]